MGERGLARAGGAAALLLAAALLANGCSRGDGQGNSASAGLADRAYAGDRGGRSGGGGGGDYGDRADRAPVPLFHGEPMWTENRSHSAQDNAQYHFQRAGADLGAKTLDDFLTKVHRFGDHPPPGTLKLTRANGDRLLYDPKANLFGVFTRQGAPRTVFKPSDGMGYWTEQKASLARGDDGYHRRSYGGGGGGGYGGGERSGRADGE